MSLSEIRENKIKQLEFLAQTKEEKKIVIKAASEICDAADDELACKIADKYRKKLSASSLITNAVDVIAILLKGGHIAQFAHSLESPKDVSYLMFIHVPDPPNKKTLVGHITKKQFHELCNKGIITERMHLRYTDNRGRSYSYYHLSEDIILRIKGECEI